MLGMLNRPLFNNKKRLIDMSDNDKNDQKTYKKFRQEETKIYEELHKVVMNDNGQTNLNKRQYDHPGYTKVPKKGERHLCKLDPERSFDREYTDLEPAKDSVEKFVDTEVF
jgi:hypothetical protein